MMRIENSISWVHRLAATVTVIAFFTMAMGTLAASNAAATLGHSQGSVGQFNWARLSGGVKYEPAYHIMAAASSLLAAGLAISLWRCGAERYIKILGLLNAAAGALQLFLCNVPAGTGQTLGETSAITFASEIFLTLSVSLALFTRTDWHWDEPKTADVATPSFRSLLVFTSAAAWIASMLGTRTHPSIFPHVLSGCIVTLSSLWALEVALNKFSKISALKISAILLAELTGLQLFLGIVAHSMELNARATALPMPGLVVIITTHTVVGALVLISSLFATFQAFKYLAPRTAKLAVPSPAEREDEVYDQK